LTRDSGTSSSIPPYEPYPEDYPLLDELKKYSRDVIAGRVVACQKHKWACERFLRDLKRQGKKDFPYVFSEEKALRFLDWMKLFRHRKGVLKGKRIEPHIIQRFVFGNVYGWIHKETGYRRFRKMYWQVARKNAKSQSLACVGTYEEAAMDAGVAEVYCAATKADQARIVWREADAMVRQCPELKGKFKTSYGRLWHIKTDSFMAVLSREDSKTGDGLDPQCGIVDEYHAHDTTEFYDILDSGMVARPEPLLAIITTAGFDLTHPCYTDEYKYVSNILNPDVPIENDEYFVMINELDKDENGNLIDDIRDEKCWAKANPIVCSYPEGIKSLRQALKAALDSPGKMRNFLTKSMNVWVTMREQGYMRMDKWAACKTTIDPESLRGMECYLGIDLSAKIDLTSVTFEFPKTDKRYAILSHSFIPAETLEEKRERGRAPWDLWEKQGWITVTPGAVVDYEYIKKYIKEQVEQYGWIIREVCYDPWNATQFANDMAADGKVTVEIVQGIKTLGEPTKDFRESVYTGRVEHDGNPVLAWAMGNAIVRMDHNENIMLDKKKSHERIDPAAATIIAHVRAMHHEMTPVDDVSEFAQEDFLKKLWGR
jgi:phage terminase large subunit-like protein